MIAEMLERNGEVERDLAWVIPRILDPLLMKRGWSALINPAGEHYATGAGRTLAPLLPQVLCDDILAQGTDALISFTPRAKSCDAVWRALEMVSPAYLGLIVAGAKPLLSARSLHCSVSPPDQPVALPSPRF